MELQWKGVKLNRLIGNRNRRGVNYESIYDRINKKFETIDTSPRDVAIARSRSVFLDRNA